MFLDSKEIKSVNPKYSEYFRILGIFTGRADAAVEVSILWSPDVTN